MMTSEKRTCNGCNYPVTYHVINEGYDPHTYRQFVYVALTGSHAGLAETGDYCPQCRRELTLESTSPVVEPKVAPRPVKKRKVAKVETVLLLADDSEDSYRAINVLADARIPFEIQRKKRGGAVPNLQTPPNDLWPSENQSVRGKNPGATKSFVAQNQINRSPQHSVGAFHFPLYYLTSAHRRA